MWVDLTKCHKCVTWAHIVIITHMHIQIHTRTHAYAVTSLHIWAHTHLEIERYREPHNEWDYCTFLIPDLFCSLVVVWIVHLLFCSWALLCVWVPSSVSSSATLYFSPASWHVPHKSPNSWATVSMCHYHSSLLYPQETMLIDALSSVSSHGAPRLSLSLSLCVSRRTPILCSSTIWMSQPSRIVGNHVVRSCAPSIQTRRSGPSGPRRSWLASSSPCVSIWIIQQYAFINSSHSSLSFDS